MPDNVAMIEVHSSNIFAIGFDAAHHTLYVEFHSGDTWVYREVSAETHRRFLGAASKGAFFAANIKGAYASYRVRGTHEVGA